MHSLIKNCSTTNPSGDRMADRTAKLGFDNKEVTFPILDATIGQDVIDIRALGKENIFTYDPGFMATAACQSKITFIDGDKGVLLHRGYPIKQLADNSDYLEVCYLLLN